MSPAISPLVSEARMCLAFRLNADQRSLVVDHRDFPREDAPFDHLPGRKFREFPKPKAHVG